MVMYKLYVSKCYVLLFYPQSWTPFRLVPDSGTSQKSSQGVSDGPIIFDLCQTFGTSQGTQLGNKTIWLEERTKPTVTPACHVLVRTVTYVPFGLGPFLQSNIFVCFHRLRVFHLCAQKSIDLCQKSGTSQKSRKNVAFFDLCQNLAQVMIT